MSFRQFTWTKLAHCLYRFIQLVFACAVIGYYASDLNAAHKRAKYTDSKWAYAVAVGSLAAITALILLIVALFAEYATVALIFAWEWLLVLLWAVVAGIFGVMYINENPEMDRGIVSMRTAAILDIVNLLLWLITAVLGVVLFFLARGGKSLHTGRARV